MFVLLLRGHSLFKLKRTLCETFLTLQDRKINFNESSSKTKSLEEESQRVLLLRTGNTHCSGDKHVLRDRGVTQIFFFTQNTALLFYPFEVNNTLEN